MVRRLRAVFPEKAGVAADDSRHRGAIAMLGILLVAAIALPLSGIALLSVWDSHNTLNDTRPVWVSARAADAEVRSAVDIVLEWHPVPSLLSPNWTGTVTAVEKIPVEGLHSGDPVARVDGVLRIAAHTPSPFYRAVAVGDRGADVAIVNELLLRLGFTAASGDQFNRATLEGVRQFASWIGVADAAHISSFDPSWIIYLPAEGIAGAEFTLKVGSPASAAGTEIIEPTLRLTSGSLTAPGAVVSETQGEPAEIDVTRPVATSVPDSARFAMPEGAVLEYAGQALTVADASSLTPEAIALLSGSVPRGAKSVRALVVTEPQRGSILIPSSAIYATADGSFCVTRRASAGIRGIPVAVVSNSAGMSVVTGDLKVADEVLIGATAEQRTCKSP